MAASDKKYRQRPEVVTRDIVGETLLVPVHGKLANMHQIYTLTPVAAFIWRELDGTKTVRDIVLSVTSHFETENRQANTDCTEFIEQLKEADLVVEV